MVTMFARFGVGKKPNASAPAASGNTPANMTQEQANTALTNALHKVANVKLRNAIKAATAAANAKGADKNNKIAELQAALNAAKPVAEAAAAAAPNKPADNQTVNAANSLIAKVAAGANNINKTSNNNFRQRPTYSSLSNSNKAKVNAALAKRRRNVSENIIQKLKNKTLPNANGNERFAFLTSADRNYIRSSA
jgi:hypothetical protein